jgi:hypothetical protein
LYGSGQRLLGGVWRLLFEMQVTYATVLIERADSQGRDTAIKPRQLGLEKSTTRPDG